MTSPRWSSNTSWLEFDGDTLDPRFQFVTLSLAVDILGASMWPPTQSKSVVAAVSTRSAVTPSTVAVGRSAYAFDADAVSRRRTSVSERAVASRDEPGPGSNSAHRRASPRLRCQKTSGGTPHSGPLVT